MRVRRRIVFVHPVTPTLPWMRPGPRRVHRTDSVVLSAVARAFGRRAPDERCKSMCPLVHPNVCASLAQATK
jgi:hypothetical protein